MVCAVLLGSLLPVAAWSESPRADADKPAELALYRDCLVKKVQPAQSAVAAGYLQQACARTFVSPKGASPAKSGTQRPTMADTEQTSRAVTGPFDDCLFQYLPTVHNDQSANAMVELCKEQFGDGTDGAATVHKPNKILQLLGIGSQKPEQEHPDMTIEGDSFVPLVPWQGGQAR
ncbi:MAG: hypothetical protein HQL87_08840 [Magnetococcales bacterium]|nr:hypothetical protein [Magnetococcales bacterium]